jgi:hypothetical protein
MMGNTQAVSTSLQHARRPLARRARHSGGAPYRRHPLVYLRSAAAGPWQLVVVASGVVLGYAQCSVVGLLIAFAVAEAILLGIVSRLSFFRRHVDMRLARAAQARAADQRASLLARMGEEHRHELAMLEFELDRIREAAAPEGLAAGPIVEECRQLLTSYVRLAIACRDSRECLAAVDRARLSEECRALEAASVASPVVGAIELVRQRLVVVHERIERWERTRETLAILMQRIALVADLVRLAHERIAAPSDPERGMTRVSIDDGAGDAEVAELLHLEPLVDADVLELGRVVPVPRV